MEFELLEEKLEVESFVRKYRWAEMIKMFVESKTSKSMILKCKNTKERTTGIQCLRQYIKKNNLNMVVGPHGSVEIYVVKA